MREGLPDAEREAMLGDKMAAVLVVSALRCYREAVKEALGRSWSGTLDSATVARLQADLEYAEDLLWDES